MATDLGEWRGVPHAIVPNGYTVIRPIAKPFKVEGDGWFHSRDGSWIKMTNESTVSDHDGWYDNGKHASGDADLDLIARATPQQAAILDAL